MQPTNSPRFKGIFASSSDPSGQTLSLTVESFSKVIIGLVTWYAMSKQMDVATAQNQAQAIIDLVAQILPMGYTLWHSAMTLWGLIRKAYVYFFAVSV